MTPNAQMFLVKLPCYRLILPLSIMALVYYSGGELICFRKLNRLRGYFIIFHGLDKKMRIFSKIGLSDSETPTHSSQSQRCSNAKSLEKAKTNRSQTQEGADKKGANGEVSSRRAD